MKESKFYHFARVIITFFMKLVYRPTYIGREFIPDKGRIVLGGNHTNDRDCLLLISSTKRTIHFLAKEELLNGKFGFIFRWMGIIPVNREIHDKDALSTAIQVLNADKAVGIFPEGTINRTDDTIMPFKIGCVKMAYDTDSYIVPFVITGEYKAFKKSVKVQFLEPFKPINEDLSIDNELLMQKISEVIKKENE